MNKQILSVLFESSNQSVYIKPANETDVKDMIDIDSTTPTGWKNTSSFLKPSYKNYVIHSDDKSVGFFTVEPHDDSTHIVKLTIHSNHRGKGLGDYALRYMKNNFNKLTLNVRESNISAQQLYKKHGFKVDNVVPKYYRNGEASISMSKE